MRDGWSVRKLEEMARGGSAAKSGRTERASSARHPDEEAALAQIADALSAALGAEVRVRPSRGGYRAEFEVASAEEALEITRRLRPRAVA